jgi:hypothetical protein
MLVWLYLELTELCAAYFGEAGECPCFSKSTKRKNKERKKLDDSDNKHKKRSKVCAFRLGVLLFLSLAFFFCGGIACFVRFSFGRCFACVSYMYMVSVAHFFLFFVPTFSVS